MSHLDAVYSVQVRRVQELETALQEIANRAGSPTASYAPEPEWFEQRKSLDWVAARAATALRRSA